MFGSLQNFFSPRILRTDFRDPTMTHPASQSAAPLNVGEAFPQPDRKQGHSGGGFRWLTYSMERLVFFSGLPIVCQSPPFRSEFFSASVALQTHHTAEPCFTQRFKTVQPDRIGGAEADHSFPSHFTAPAFSPEK